MNSHTIWSLIYALMALTPTVLFVAVLVKHQMKRQRRRQSEGPLVEDPATLHAAELALGGSDYRKELFKTHLVLDVFSTTQHYSSSYMDQLVRSLNDNGIEATYFFQESVPVGVVSMTGATGVYELFVPRGSEGAAQTILYKFRSSSQSNWEAPKV